MPRYLIQASYTREGVHGLLKESGSSRIETVTELIKGMGGTVEAFYFAFGDDDVVGIVDMPDNATITALALVINASGAVGVRTTALITPAEVDEPTKKTVDYRAPGQ